MLRRTRCGSVRPTTETRFESSKKNIRKAGNVRQGAGDMLACSCRNVDHYTGMIPGELRSGVPGVEVSPNTISSG
jgi:hypothetical protein